MTCNIDPWLQTVDNFGNDQYAGSPQPHLCRFEPHIRMMSNSKGEVRQVVGKLIIVDAVGDKDRIWIPGDATTNADLARYPVRLDTAVDYDGSTQFFVVWL